MQRILSALELKISPVMLTLLAAAGMWLVDRAFPCMDVPVEIRVALAAGFFIIAAGIGVAGVWSFRKARTTVNPWRVKNATELVQTGIYRYSRNPMYLALLCALIGWGVFLANGYSLVLAFLFVPFLNRFQIQPEERALRSVFGKKYNDYCEQVRRWI
jgi:protein-S-isoprenylcysteine O-methyltransferase Ste14